MDAKDKILVDIQENKKYSHIRIADGLSAKKSDILRKVMIKYDSDFKRMAKEV
nr:MAG TPA: hypothetical protein [Bacteriophage sp.]